MKIIKLDGVVGKEIVAKDIINELNANSGDKRYLLNSAGGVLFDGIEIYNAFRNYNEGKIIVEAGALVGSIASYFAMGADEFIVHDNTTFMIHNAHTVSQGDYNSFEKTAKTLEGVTQHLRNAYATKSGKSIEAITTMLDKETYIFGSEIVSHGFADRLIVSGEDITAIAAIDSAKEKIINCANNCESRFESESEKITAILAADEKQNKLKEEQNKILKEVGLL